MEPTRAHRRRIVASAVGIAAATALFADASPAHAQGRFRVLVPALAPQEGVDEDFGEDVAARLRERIEDMPRHTPIERDEMRTALRRVKIDEEDLYDCVKSRQLAVRMKAELVLCGSYQAAGSGMQVAARFVMPLTGEEFPIEPFTAASPDEAAQRLLSGLETMVNQQLLSTFCLEYLASEHWANALENCNKALAINPNSAATLYGRARALVGLDSLEQSLEVLVKLLELNPTHGDGLQTAGYVATKLNRPEQALEYYRTYLELNPGNSDVRLRIATELFNNGDPKGALLLTEEGMSVDSTNVNLRLYAGHFALAAAQKLESEHDAGPDGAERPPEAVELYEKALGYYETVFAEQGNEADVVMLKNMMSALVLLERTEEAVEMGARFVQAKPDDASLWSTYADALQKLGRLDEALAALDSTLARDPNYQSIYSRQVSWFTNAGQLSRIKEAFDKAVTRQEFEAKPDELAHNVLGYAYNEKFQKGDQQGALPYLELVRELNTTPDTRGLASYLAGFALLTRGRQVEAPQTLQSAREALPIFRKALQYFQDARPYAESSNVDLGEPIAHATRFIEIQEAVIKRGS